MKKKIEKSKLRRVVSAECLDGRRVMSAALLSRFGSGSRTTWPCERFSIEGLTSEVSRAQRYIESPFIGKDVVVCRNLFTPRPPKKLEKLGAVVRRSSSSLLDEPNAGGSSDQSEAVSFAMLKVLFDAELVATEMKVKYEWSGTKKIDYLARARDLTLGVSVTRAYRHRGKFDSEDAVELLCKKLHGLYLASRAVCDCHEWDIPVLHIWCSGESSANLIAAELVKLRNEHIWPLRLFDLANMRTPLIMLTSTSSIERVIFKNESWTDDCLRRRNNIEIDWRLGGRNSSFSFSQRRARQSRQSMYAAYLPSNYTPPVRSRRLEYFT